MKKYIQLLSIASVTLLALFSCVDDKGSYDYIEMNDLTIAEVPEDATVEQFTKLEITPDITAKEGTFNPDGYTYNWILFQIYTTGTVTADTISQEKDLNVEIGAIPGEYRIHYEVKDKKTDLIYTTETYLTVINSYSLGMMALSRVGNDANVTFINKVENVVQDAYVKVNGKPAGQNPTGICKVGGLISSANDMVVIMTDDGNGGVVVDPLDMSYVMNTKELFYFPPANNRPQAFGVHEYTAFEYVINDGGIYTRKVMGDGAYPKYGVRVKGDYGEIAPFNFFNAVNPQAAVFYDQTKRRFVSMAVPLQGDAIIPIADNYEAEFNPNNIGMKMLWGALVGTTWACYNGRTVMKADDGSYYMLSFKLDKNKKVSPIHKFQITTEGIERSKSYTTAQNGNFLYYAYDNKIACLSFNTGNFMSLFELGDNSQQIDYIECDQKGDINQLWVGVSDGSGNKQSGTIVVLEMSTDGSLKELKRYPNVCGQVVDFEYKK